jgi:putative CocE/NonD family hydrolase
MFKMITEEVTLAGGEGMVIEKDVAIPMRDGAILYADVFRPKAQGTYPVLINISCYQKDKLWVPPPDLEEKADPYMNWETVTPSWWIPHGYACVRVDTRGSGKSPGLSDPGSWQEALDFYDAIEWSAKQAWCSGRVGTAGISYHATSQWKVAGMKPPSLKAIMPWEGWADAYRDSAYHGGIFALYFIATWTATHIAHHLLGKPATYNPDAFRNERLWQYARHNLDSGWWDNRKAHWDKIDVLLYSVGNWSGMALHLRGNVEGFTRAASKHKKLRIHTGTHYHPFYSEEGKRDQLRFWDHWLKGKDTGIMDEPPVKLLIRTGGGGPYAFRYENEWPLARTQWTRFYLKAEGVASADAKSVDGRLTTTQPEAGQPLTYGATGMAKGGAGAIASSTTLAAGVSHRMGFRSRPSLCRRTRKSRARSTWCCGYRARAKTWTSLQRSGTSTRTVTMSGKSGSRARRYPSRKAGCALRIVSSTRSCRHATGLITSTSSACRSRRASPSNARSKSGRRAWCSGRAIAYGSTSSLAMAREARRIRITTPTTITVRTPYTPAGTRRLMCCCL